MMFSPAAQWIWDAGDRQGYQRYVEARRAFRLTPTDLLLLEEGTTARLLITADAYYQVTLNGTLLGHGPAKSAEGRRSVDAYDITRWLRVGDNELHVLAMSMGAGAMTYCPSEAGLIFQLELPGHVLESDGHTMIRPDHRRQHPTVRRWFQPAVDDVDAAATHEAPWEHARSERVFTHFYPRRVPLPSRDELRPRRLVCADRVTLPTLCLGVRARAALLGGFERLRSNGYATPAYFVTEVISPVAQDLRLVPAPGGVIWHHAGRRVCESNGWSLWDVTQIDSVVPLQPGPNRLIGVHTRNHPEDITLAGSSAHPVTARNPFGPGFCAVLPTLDGAPAVTGAALNDVDWSALVLAAPRADEDYSYSDGNPQALAGNAVPLAGSADAAVLALARQGLPATLELPPAVAGQAVRVVLDLGTVTNGWLAFSAHGRQGSRLIVSLFEGLDEGPPLRIQWPQVSNNAISYRPRDGWQDFETFHAYGGRYLALYHTGPAPLTLTNLRVLTANCGSRPRGTLLTPDPLLNEIYQIAQQTVIAGVDDTFTDCPLFEQVNWNFDNRTAFLGEVLCLANLPVARNSIQLFAEDPRHRGMVLSQYPSAWDCFIPLWSMHWVMWCRDYLWFSGEPTLPAAVVTRLRTGLDDLLAHVNADGLFAYPGGTPERWHFVEWGHGRDDNQTICGAEQAGLVGALRAVLAIAPQLGEGFAPHVARYQAALDRLVYAINAHLWQADRHAYADSLHADGTPSPVSSQATNAMMALYGVAKGTKRTAILAHLHAGRLLPIGSPYGLYYILELYDQEHDGARIFAHIAHRWGDMVRAGDHTTWETFAEYGMGGWPTRSRCHPFAAYVIKYLVKYLLGVEATAPGFREFRVVPRPPAGLATAQGTVPTPAGLIRVAWTRADGVPVVRVEHPSALQRVE